MRLDHQIYGPHGTATYESFNYYAETTLEYGQILNDSDDSVGFGIQFQQTGTISGIGLYIVEYVGTPNYVIGFTTISGTLGFTDDPYPNFNPTTRVGSLYSNSEWQDFDPVVVGSGWSWIDLSTPVNVTKGETAAIIIVPSGATVPDASNFAEINDESAFWGSMVGQWRYYSYWSHYNWESPIAVKYSDGTLQGFALVGLPWEEYSSPEEWGVEFQLPVKATCVGGVFNLYQGDSFPTDAPFKLILVDSSDGELASTTILDHDLVENYNNYSIHLAWDTETDPILDADTIYRLYLKPTSAEVVDKKGFILDTEASKVGLPGGTNWKWIERSTPASGWTYKPDQYPWLSLALVDLTSAAIGGGEGDGNSSYGFIG